MPPVSPIRSSDDFPISNPGSGARSSAQEHKIAREVSDGDGNYGVGYRPLMHDDPLKPVEWIQQLPHTTMYAVWLGVEWFGLELLLSE